VLGANNKYPKGLTSVGRIMRNFEQLVDLLREELRLKYDPAIIAAHKELVPCNAAMMASSPDYEGLLATQTYKHVPSGRFIRIDFKPSIDDDESLLRLDECIEEKITISNFLFLTGDKFAVVGCVSGTAIGERPE
jgi:hypothetical protein